MKNLTISSCAHLSNLRLGPFQLLLHFDLEGLVALDTNKVLGPNLLCSQMDTVVHFVLASLRNLRPLSAFLVCQLHLNLMQVVGHSLVDNADPEKTICGLNHLLLACVLRE